jgi:hypothetical protein
VLAKHFRRQLLRNMNRGKVRKAEMGRKAGGADIFGYKTNENGEYALQPEQAKVVQLIFELVAKDHSRVARCHEHRVISPREQVAPPATPPIAAPRSIFRAP